MKNIISFLPLLVIGLMLSSCSTKPADRLVGKVFVHEENGAKQIVGFHPDKIIFKWDDSLGVDLHESSYNINPVNDSLFRIEVKDKSKYMEGNTWEIIMDSDDSFYTVESKKRYVLSEPE